MPSTCHLNAITVRDCSSTRGQGIATRSCTPEIVATSVHTARLPSQGGELQLQDKEIDVVNSDK